MKKIRILSGAKGQGKSSRLKKVFTGMPGAEGIITLRREGDFRDFYILSTGESWSMQGAENYAGPWLEVGRFRFSAEAFGQASQYLLEAARNTGTKLLIVDEVGPLELRKEGFYKALKEVMENPPGPDLLLVVRSELVEEVKQFFAVPDADVLSCDSLGTRLF
jgi:nucleoside-triphosphatase THEP1